MRTTLLSLVLFPLAAFGQVSGPVQLSPSGGFSGSQINHVILCDTYYKTLQACITAAGTSYSVIIPTGLHMGETFTNPNSLSVLDLRNGGVSLSGPLTLPSDPTSPQQAVTKNYVDITACMANGNNCPTLDLIKPAFTLSLNGGQTLEIGQSVTNPTFTASYNQTPSSASLTNTASINSPFNLVSPFTSATLTGTFTAATASSVSFTLSATSGTITKTTGTSFQWLPRNWGGVGAAGAASATVSGTTATLNTGATLSNLGLTSNNSGHVYGPFSASSQKIYLLLSDTNHTFKDNGSGFAMPFNTPTTVSVVNQYGATVTMYLYELTNIVTGSFSVLVN